MKCGVWRVQCEVWGVKNAVWSLECEGSSEKWEVWSVDSCGLWSVKCEVWSVKCEVWSVKVKCAQWSVKSAGRSVKGEVELQMWHVKQNTTFAECTHARAWLAHGACKFYRWERSYIYIYIFKATSAPPRAGTTGKQLRWINHRILGPYFQTPVIMPIITSQRLTGQVRWRALSVASISGSDAPICTQAKRQSCGAWICGTSAVKTLEFLDFFSQRWLS